MENSRLSSMLLFGLSLLAAVSCDKINIAPSSSSSKDHASASAISTATAGSAQRAIVTHYSARLPDDTYFFDQCTQEEVHFDGYALTMSQTTINGNNFRFSIHYDPSNEAVVSPISGIVYHGVGSMDFSSNGSFVNGSFSTARTGKIGLISPGKAANASIKFNIHIGINANGALTVNRDGFTFDCH